MRRYELFGLSLDSELALPELNQGRTIEGSTADLSIRLARELEAKEGFTLDVESVARFHISNGRLIVVEPYEGVGEREVRLFLLGSAMGIALHQRGLLPLHANAVEIDGSAIAFMGKSGSGKSTLAAWFHDQGFRVLADDVCVVRPTAEGIPLAYPGLPRLRLWQDALEASGRDVNDHALSFHLEDDDRRKFDVRIPPEAVSSSAVPLRALFVLERGEEIVVERMSGAAAVETIAANTYRGEYISEIGDVSAHVAACVRLALAIPIFRLVRPFDRAAFNEPAATILAFCRSI